MQQCEENVVRKHRWRENSQKTIAVVLVSKGESSDQAGRDGNEAS